MNQLIKIVGGSDWKKRLLAEKEKKNPRTFFYLIKGESQSGGRWQADLQSILGSAIGGQCNIAGGMAWYFPSHVLLGLPFSIIRISPSKAHRLHQQIWLPTSQAIYNNIISFWSYRWLSIFHITQIRVKKYELYLTNHRYRRLPQWRYKRRITFESFVK